MKDPKTTKRLREQIADIQVRVDELKQISLNVVNRGHPITYEDLYDMREEVIRLELEIELIKFKALTN